MAKSDFLNIFKIVDIYYTEGINVLKNKMLTEPKPKLLDNLSLEVYNLIKKKDPKEAINLIEEYSKSIKKR